MVTKILLVCWAFFVLVISASCGSSNSLNISPPLDNQRFINDGDSFKFNAKILEIHSTEVLVEPLAGQDILRSADRIIFLSGHLNKIDVSVGDVVTIQYNGAVMESYPARIIAISWSILQRVLEDNDE
jgi:hypothetical protein